MLNMLWTKWPNHDDRSAFDSGVSPEGSGFHAVNLCSANVKSLECCELCSLWLVLLKKFFFKTQMVALLASPNVYWEGYLLCAFLYFWGVQYAKRQSLTPCFSLTCLEKSSDGMQNSVAETQHKGTRSVSLPVQMNYVTHYLVYLWCFFFSVSSQRYFFWIITRIVSG
jgi:hypothetical protein